MNDKRSQNPKSTEKGQSIIILAATFLAFIAIVGLAIDLGLVYIERVKIARAVDAAALAAVQELPNEQLAQLRALEYLGKNGYDLTNSRIELSGTVKIGSSWVITHVITGNLASDTVFVINTADYVQHEDPDDPLSPKIPNSACRIEVGGTTPVEMNFMQLLGFGAIDVGSEAVAESVNSLDVAIILDDSGSMNYDTICHGCYEQAGQIYPLGNRYPLTWPPTNPSGQELCGALSPTNPGFTQDAAGRYITIEAEHYTLYEPDYHGAYRDRSISYWVVQRNGGSDTSANGVDASPNNHRPYMRHNPWTNYAGAPITARSWDDLINHPGVVPRLDYQFQVPTDQGGIFYIWVRGMGGTQPEGGVSPSTIYWGLNGSPVGSESNFETASNTGAPNSRWRWRRLGNTGNLAPGSINTLNIWAGGIAVKIDKIVLTTSNSNPPAALGGTGVGPAESARLFGLACNICSVPYGRGPADGCSQDNQNDDIFVDDQPLRGAKEAIKNFAGKLDPRYDQFGLVRYDSSSSIGLDGDDDGELHCLVMLGQDACADEYETAYVDVLDDVSNAVASGSTNISDALWDGIRVLMTRAEDAPVTSDPDNLFKVTNHQHYGRPQANHVMILLTDGVANRHPGKCDNGDFQVAAAHKYLGPDGHFGEFWADGGTDHDCLMFFAYAARSNLITLYTIGLGDSLDEGLLKEAAEKTGGAYYHAPDRDRLQEILDDIFERIYVRLIR